MIDTREIEGAPILFDPLTCISGVRPGNDLALIRLKVPFNQKNADKTQNIDLIGLEYPFFALASDFREEMRPGRQLKVVGYGETEIGRIAVRMKASVPVLTPDCMESPHSFYCASFREMIFADRTGSGRVPRDTCGGDSGGPVFVRRMVTMPQCPQNTISPPQFESPTTQPQDVLVAITSRAAPLTPSSGSQPCGGGGVYTLIGRRDIYAWFDQNHVATQRCIAAPKK